MDGAVIDPFALVWWLFFLWLFITFLTPQLRYSSLRAARQRLLAQLEAKLGAKVITMIHRQETISLFGIPIYRFITIEDAEAVIRAIRQTPPGTPIALILHTPGGLVLAASQIARALKAHNGRKIVIVPHYAMSGGTLIALAADEIWMDRDAVLGPVDPQIPFAGRHVPAPSVLRAYREKGRDASDELLIAADVAEKAIRQVKAFVEELLRDKLGDRAREVAERLVEGYYTHDYPLTVDELRAMGLPIRTELPPEVYQLMELYPQEGAARPSIEFVPGIPPRPPPTQQT